MSTRLFDHIDLRVKNREAAQRFYAQILPAIGFPVDKSGEKWGLFEAEGNVVGGRAILRLKNLSGIERELADLALPGDVLGEAAHECRKLSFSLWVVAIDAH